MAKATAGTLATALGAVTATDDVYLMQDRESTGECMLADVTLVTLPGGGVGIKPFTAEEKIDNIEAVV